MNKLATVRTMASVSAAMLGGVVFLQCGPVQPIQISSATGGFNSGASNGAGSLAGGASGAGGAKSGGGINLVPTPGADGSAEPFNLGLDAPPASAETNCGVQTQNPSPQAVDLLVVLDRSSSMSYDMTTDVACVGRGACTTKWSTMTNSLAQVLATSPAGVQWGLKFFTSPGTSGKCTVSPGAEVGVGPGTATKIQSAMTSNSPGNQTPTTAAINAAVAYYKTVNDGLAHYILLATDGQPNCDPGTSSDINDTTKLNAANAIAAALTTANIKTYVIGIGLSVGSLDNFAQAGGTGNYYPATSPDALTAALNSIIVSVASCSFKMSATPDDPGNLGVYLDKDNKVPLDATNGYSLGTDNVTVTFNGSYCDGIKDGTYQVVQVFFGCPGQAPPGAIP